MAQLAIIGHPTRGKEVIELLEMLGGKNHFSYDGAYKTLIYTIGSELELDVFNVNYSYGKDGYIVFTLEEFLEKYPYKVGDKVNYVKYNDGYQNIYTIQKAHWTGTTIEYLLDSSGFGALTKDLQPYKEETMEEGVYAYNEINCYHQDFTDKVRIRLGGDYEIKEEEGKTYIVRKKPQYPKTYAECASILCDRASLRNNIGYKGNLLVSLQKLLICRGAYWKIAGERMGLGKPWEPDWSTENEIKYVIEVYHNNVRKNSQGYSNTLLAFPTEEMRDAFYENFKDLIEVCKELL